MPNTKKLEEIFELADEAIKSYTIDNETKLIEMKPDSYEVIEDVDLGDENVMYEISELKADFIITKRNLKKLIRTGMDIMTSAGGLSALEMNGSQFQGIAAISTALTAQLKLMVELYKDIEEISKIKRMADNPLMPNVGQVSGDFNQQVIFTGSSADLLKELKKKDV